MTTHQADENSPLYYTTARCGCVKMLTADMPERAREVAQELADAVRRGEQVHTGIARDVWNGTIALSSCDQCTYPKRADPMMPEHPHNARIDRDLERLQAWNEGRPIHAG